MSDPMSPADIEAAADAAGTTAFRLCRAAGVSHSVWSRWKRGQRGIKLDSYRRLVEALRRAQQSEAAA